MRVSYSKDPRIRLFQINILEILKKIDYSLTNMFVTSRVKFVIMIFAISSGYWEYYLNRINYATFLVN